MKRSAILVLLLLAVAVLVLAGCSETSKPSGGSTPSKWMPPALARAQVDSAKQHLAKFDVIGAKQLLNQVKGKADPTSPEYKEAVELLDKIVSDPTLKLKYAQKQAEDADEAVRFTLYEEARRHLEACLESSKPGSSLFVSCEKKLFTVDAKLQEVRRSAAAAQREGYASTVERKMLEEGQDMYVRAEGPHKETLRLTYVLINRPFVYKFQTDESFMSNLRKLGFKRVIFTDGYNSTWSIPVN